MTDTRALIEEWRKTSAAYAAADTRSEWVRLADYMCARGDRLADALEAASKDRDRAWAANERDRTGYAGLIHSLREWVRRWSWLQEGRGPYEWDDDRWHGEFGTAQREIEKIANRAERKTHATDLRDCPTTTEAVLAARAEPDTEEEDTDNG